MRSQWHRLVRVGVLGAFAAVACAAGAQGVPTSASNAAEDFCAGKLSSEQLVSAALTRAKQRADLNAFVTLDEAGALAAAQRADASKGHARCRPLSGVPIVVKDNIEVARLPSTGGTPALKGYVPKADAPVVKRLRDAGAIVLGKTNMHELAFGISGYNPAYNTGAGVGVRNAYDASRSAGGSSSGTGAALGARIVLAGLGTDTGGSVRVPCAFNGCASLRPTVGRYSQKGILPISHTRDTAGPMALAMTDVELLDRVISGAKPAKAADLKTVRLGLVND
ncbi:MAG TPA: amidase family protein, partial [Burkholderiaceae bacterium]|nr:amidase family protein [Burkholderiaceae bacterium]